MTGRKTPLLAIAVCAGIFTAHTARAYESQCENELTQSRARDLATMQETICAAPNPATQCAEGLGFARGAQLGEHAWITSVGMAMAGLSSYVNRRAFPKYYRTTAIVGGEKTLEPAVPGVMKELLERATTIPELAQALDGSYSLSDYILGNEHCLVPFVPRATAADVNRCHSFAAHMGATNSNHFLPQARAMYSLYHGHAMAIAKDCRKINDALKLLPAAHPLKSELTAIVEACEIEALSFQSVANHFQGDAWSTGHMWQRWGSPVFPPSGGDSGWRAQTVALVSGLVHGWRTVVRASLGKAQHDQLCMPGFFDDYTPGEESDHLDESVFFTYDSAKLGSYHAPAFGGGDLYLLACNARNQDPRWAIAPTTDGGVDTSWRPLSQQYRRMMACVARGFEEVYQAGPQLDGPRAFSTDDGFMASIASSTENSCWDQRVTNQSLLNGTGVTASGTFADLNRWLVSFFTKVSIELIPDVARAQQDPGFWDFFAAAGRTLLGIENDLRIRLGEMGLEMERVAARNRNGTELAELSPSIADGGLAELLGIRRNEESVALITGDQVPFLEPNDRKTWSHWPANSTDCISDEQCPLSATSPSLYCEPTRFADAGRCVRRETAVLRAYQKAETAYWCGNASWSMEVNEAHEACKASGGTACDACVDVVLPHIRNACDPPAYEGTDAGYDQRSICDALADLNLAPRYDESRTATWPVLPLYKPFDESAPGALRQAARDACEQGAEVGGPWGHDYVFNKSPPAAENIDATWSQAATKLMCGAGVGTHWWHFSHGPQIKTHAHYFKIEPFDWVGRFASASRFDFVLIQGPNCESGPVLSVATPIDANSDGTPEALMLTWTVPQGASDDVCVRLKAKDRKVWTGYHWSRWYEQL